MVSDATAFHVERTEFQAHVAALENKVNDVPSQQREVAIEKAALVAQVALLEAAAIASHQAEHAAAIQAHEAKVAGLETQHASRNASVGQLTSKVSALEATQNEHMETKVVALEAATAAVKAQQALEIDSHDAKFRELERTHKTLADQHAEATTSLTTKKGALVAEVAALKAAIAADKAQHEIANQAHAIKASELELAHKTLADQHAEAITSLKTQLLAMEAQITLAHASERALKDAAEDRASR